MRLRHLVIFGLFGLFLVLGACAEQAGTGEPTKLPTVTINCTSSHCRTNTSAIVFVRITSFNCDADANSENNATAATSINITCNATSGCYGVATSWNNSRGPVTTIPSSSYTVCGRIDYAPTNYPSITTDDTTAILPSVSISKSSGAITLNTWTDP